MTIKDRKYWQDLGSDEVNLLREQLNRITDFLQKIKDAADDESTGDAFRTAVAALEEPDFENLIPDPKLPKPRRQKLK